MVWEREEETWEGGARHQCLKQRPRYWDGKEREAELEGKLTTTELEKGLKAADQEKEAAKIELDKVTFAVQTQLMKVWVEQKTLRHGFVMAMRVVVVASIDKEAKNMLGLFKKDSLNYVVACKLMAA